ncbi:MAG TPA: hypothetical protein VKK79_09630 [Candidatus Lokiarchaeia archaeon]|nr:hypothetical protein [Candidatus Lokiarchaeia archaeon]
MPIFGLDTSIENLGEQIQEILGSKQYLFQFSPISIIEIKWQIIKLEKKTSNLNAMEVHFSHALSSLRDDTRFYSVDFLDANINDISHELRKIGHKDYFDTVIASSALWNADLFITEDEPLVKIVQSFLSDHQINGVNPTIQLERWSSFYANYSVPS